MMKEIYGIMGRGADLFRLAAMILVMACLPIGSFADQAATVQRVFSSPEEARQALITAVQAKDHDALKAIFGPVSDELASADPVERANEFDHFARHVQEGIELVKEGEAKAILLIGSRKWPFPAPVVKKGDAWLFDTADGA